MSLSSLPAVATYRHYKGGYYRVLGFCIHSETAEYMVRYTLVSGDCREEWVRPLVSFTASVSTEVGIVKRFRQVTDT